MSGYPVLLRAADLRAVVVGGGRVATRKVAALLAAGATVRVVAPRISDDLRVLAAGSGRLSLAERGYDPGDVDDAMLIVAATDDRATNARIAADARAAHRLVNVADAPEEGNCVTLATHRAGEVVVAISAGGVPGAAAKIRDAVAGRLDERYADAVAALARLRARLLEAGDRDGWREAVQALVTDDFCDVVERGDFPERVARWR